MSIRLAVKSLGCHVTRKSFVGPQSVVASRFMSHYPVNDHIFGLDEDKQKLREIAFNFSQKELAPFAKAIDKNDDFP